MPSERLSDGIFPCVLNRAHETPDAFGGNVGCRAMFGGGIGVGESEAVAHAQ
ncbi:hypothetical protein M5Z44_09625 [Neisseria meningitidis]|nr:hypothetical protein [Neisseria meningitidis]